MAFSLSVQFLLFLWFSGVNHFVNPSSEAGSGVGLEIDYQEQQDQDMVPMEDRYTHMHRFRMAMPPSHVDPIQQPIRRQYRLEDFLWTGSGDGPYPSELDGGLAWEDNGGVPGAGSFPGSPEQSRSWIKVTKTVTIYRTALTTIYPIEMTPTVISGMPPIVQPTPRLSDSHVFSESLYSPHTDNQFSSAMVEPSDNVMWIPTPTFSPSPPTPTQKPFPSPAIDISTPVATASVHQTPTPPQDNYSAESTDIVYWIQTSIKANNSLFKEAPLVFQNTMQKSLARVYASAFKRHLLSTLGVLSTNSLTPTKKPSQKRKRRRRWTGNQNDLEDTENFNYEHDHIHRWLYVAQSSMTPTQLKHLAMTSMNVTVSILNITEDKKEKGALPNKVDLTYIVLAENTPVPAFSAVKELDLVSKEEMEREIGYEIIDKKAEALVQGPPEQIARNEKIVATSPWLIVAVTTICLLVILLTLIAFMVWKWKHNRLGDSNNRRVPPAARPQSGIIEIEEGVINPAFLGTPSRTGHGESHEHTPKSSPALSLLSARARTSAKKISEVISRRRGSRKGSTRQRRTEEEDFDDDYEREKKRGRQQKGKQESPTTSEELRLRRKKDPAGNLTSSEGSADWKELLGEPKPKMEGRRGGQGSPSRSKMGASSNTEEQKESKDTLQRRKRRKTQISKIENLPLKSDEEDSEISQFSDIEELERGGSPRSGDSQRKQGPSWSRGTTDAISLGNLDVCQDTIAQTPSEYAKKLVPWRRPGSAVSSSGGSKGHHYHIGHQTGGAVSGGGMDTLSRRPGSRLALPETIEEIPSYGLTEEDREQDRDLSEKSFEMKDSPRRTGGIFASSPDTRDAQVQTPKRISKTASHKTRAAPKPRKNWRGSPGHAQSESVISTESEEIVEVHHINSSTSDEQNPLGRMRKRFHQFLDDAFNVMVSGNKREDADTKAETQSAKVSICHEVVETETEWRPWTSHVIREETLQKLRRPKSAAVPIGPPKRAWTASSERRSASAKVNKSQPESSSAPGASTSRLGSGIDFQHPPRPSRQQRIDDDDDLDTYDKTSTPCLTQDDAKVGGGRGVATSDQSHSSLILSPAFIFPQYPAYPDIRVNSGRGGGTSSSSTNISSSQSQSLSQRQPGTSAQQQPQPPPPSLPSNDPAVPLIQAIKNEMKRFEKDPSSSSK